MARGKTLYRSRDRIIAGVCGGIADYFDFDPTIFRIIYAILTIFDLLDRNARRKIIPCSLRLSPKVESTTSIRVVYNFVCPYLLYDFGEQVFKVRLFNKRLYIFS